MNKPIRNLSVFCLLLFLALLVNATLLQYWKADSLSSLSDHPDNRRVRDLQYSRERGAILVNGKAIAESVKSDDRYKFKRVYPQGPEYAQITGYFSRDYGLGGIEATEDSILSGSDSRLFVNRVIDLLGNQDAKGGNVTLTINPKAQKAAYEGLHKLGKNVQGAVVAIEPATGRVLAMVSSPTYDPNQLASHDFGSIRAIKDRLGRSGGPMENRAIETTLPPGSTFKIITASAALEKGRFTPNSKVPGGTTLDLPSSPKPLTNENHSSCGGGKITLTRALEVSCNVAFGWLGLKLGEDDLRNQAEAYGFGARYFTELDDSTTRQAISQFSQPPPGHTKLDPPFLAYSAIGQYDVRATPLQMAMTTAAIANSGTVMKPYLVDEEQSPDLDVLSKTDPQVLTKNAISPSAAGQLTDMMVGVVDSGTGTAAQIPGVRVAGKTGTAQSAPNRPPYAWFVSFAPADNPQVAVAVLVEDAGVARNQISGNGLAAPIAKAVMQAVIR